MGIARILHMVSLFALLIFSSVVVNSQQISNEIVEIDGDKFYKHSVQKGQTSFGIAKLYSVELNVLYDINPDARNGLQLNQVLYIPFKNPEQEQINPVLSINDTLSSVVHKVSAGETLWSITKKYGVSIEQLKRINSDTIEHLQIGQSILIPTSKADTSNVITPIIKNPINPLAGPCDSIFIHKVKKRETLYSISKMYSVSINSINDINSGLIEGLQKGQEIRIIVKKMNCDEKTIKAVSFSESMNDSTIDFSNDSLLSVSLLLPLMLEENDTILANCPPLQKCPLNANSIQSVHFVNGTLMAIDSLIKAGFNVELTIYDTKNDVETTKSILTDTSFIKSDLVIGPIYMRNIKLVTDFCNKFSIHIICPVPIPNQALFNNRYLTRITPSKQTMLSELAKYNLKQSEKDNRILVINKIRKNDLSYANAFKNYYNSHLTKNLDSLKTISMTSSSNLNDIKNLLNPDANNVLIVPSDDIGFVSNFMTKLSGLVNTYEYRKHQFSVYGMENWKDMQTIDEKYKNSFNLHLPMSGRVDYNCSTSVDFIKKYRTKFSFDPEKFSFIAFDVAFNAIKERMLFKENLKDYASLKSNHEGYFFKVNIFQVDSSSGFENRGVHIYRYNNHELIRLD